MQPIQLRMAPDPIESQKRHGYLARVASYIQHQFSMSLFKCLIIHSGNTYPEFRGHYLLPVTNYASCKRM